MAPVQFQQNFRSLWVCSLCKARFSTSSRSYQAFRKPNQRVPSQPTRTRFAPSPTGFLHLGSLRTALFNYLLAKRTGGSFLLRLEDTDKRRTVKTAEERLYRDLQWAGLEWDEGPEIGGPYGPYRQSERTALYREHAEKLLESGHAYRCFCSTERLHNLAKERSKLGLPTEYDRTCEGISTEESSERAAKGESFTIRLKVPAKYPDFTDLVYGKIGRGHNTPVHYKFGQAAYEDPVLLKSDGQPTYHLANVVDDHHMEITHVIRAAEWISSTPKHIALYDAFGWKPPLFAHVGLLEDETHQKLSKRNADIDITAYEKDGIFPEALLNFAALLGWSHNLKSDVMDLQELIKNFDLKFTKGNTVVAFGKLWFLQRAHAERYLRGGGKEYESMISQLSEVVKAQLSSEECSALLQPTEPWGPSDVWGIPEVSLKKPTDYRDLQTLVADVLHIDAKNYTNASRFFERNEYFFKPIRQTQRSYPATHTVPFRVDFQMLLYLRNNILFGEWTHDAIHERIEGILKEYKLDQETKDKKKLSDDDMKVVSKVFHTFLRWAITGGKPGPSIADIMEILGKRETFFRLEAAASANVKETTASLSETGLEVR
ncbi:MAG: Glutamate--tRNA ligase mitochondrial [Cirrosporium novae-zelandiae]|nr:MAG: Glutamate--tRNA ligase mitochondrial [Cirrosporium novae-zelandiae]